MQYLSVCSGIEAATAAWHPLGWKPVGFAEIDKFPARVLAHHYPDVSNFGDLNRFKEWPDVSIDCLVGGTPCQSFSVAGLRKGLDDPRGNLALTYCAILDRYKPKWFLWENVPGVLSADRGRAFGSILGAMAELGYGWAYRVLDAQYVRVDGFGRAVPQRRRRVFVVGHLGNWQRAAKVLFEPESLLWNSAPRREAGQRVAGTISSRPAGSGGLGTDFDLDGGLIAKKTLVSGGHSNNPLDENLVPIGFHHNAQADQLPSRERDTSIAESLTCSQNAAVAYDLRGRDGGSQFEGPHGTANIRAASGGSSRSYLAQQWAVRRLTPSECERLQGFPDDFTAIPGAADGPRYKALGNSMAVNVMRWLGYRITLVEASTTIDVERIRTALLAEYQAMQALAELQAAYV